MNRSTYEPEPRAICCFKCFKDTMLKATIREEGVRGTRPWCGAEKAIGIGVLSIARLVQNESRRRELRQTAARIPVISNAREATRSQTSQRQTIQYAGCPSCREVS